MKLALRTTGSLRRHLEAEGLVLEDAANAAVVRQTDETKGAMRVQIEARLSRRASFALRSKLYLDQGKGGQGTVGGYIFSAWWRKDRRGGANIDLFWAYENGAVVSSAGHQALAIPLPAAYAVAGLAPDARGRVRAPKPVDVEAALNADLFVLQRPGQYALLCAKGISTASRGKRGKLRAATYTNKRGLAARRRVDDSVIPMFVLLKNTRLPRRLDFSSIVAAAEQGLEDKFLVELARRTS